MSTFENYNLTDNLLAQLKKQNITQPTPIQEQSIPLAIEGCDILGSAQTGSGKTLAFVLPLIKRLHEAPQNVGMILAPTRELASQISKNIQSYLPRDTSQALLIGGAPMFKQLQQLKRKPSIIVGTPGRVLDHISRKKLPLSNIRYLVLDEMDRMLDMGFSEQIDDIIKEIPEDRQTLLFSATMPNHILNLAEKYQKDPKHIKIGRTSQASKNIKQSFVELNPKNKFNRLIRELGSREGSIIVFVKTKMGADHLSKQINDQKIRADALHGDLRHGKRQRVIKDFSQQKYRVLVATDIAARGLDIHHIKHVINYDLPQVAEDYIHRIGRTGRGSNTGESLCFFTQKEQRKIKMIQRLMDGKPVEEKSYRPSRKPQKKWFSKDSKPFSHKKPSRPRKTVKRK